MLIILLCYLKYNLFIKKSCSPLALQMSELLNQKSSIQGKIPSGYFNAVFDLSGAWLDDATETKHLAFDGYFISLYNLHLTGSSLVLREEIKKAVPSTWDPSALSRSKLLFTLIIPLLEFAILNTVMYLVLLEEEGLVQLYERR